MKNRLFLACATALLSLASLDAATEPRRASKRLRGEHAEHPAGLSATPKRKAKNQRSTHLLYNAQVAYFLNETQWLRTTKPASLRKPLSDCVWAIDQYKTTNDQELKQRLLPELESERIALLHEDSHCTTAEPCIDKARYHFAHATENLRASLLRKKFGCYVTELQPWEITWRLEKVPDAEFQRRINETFGDDQDKLDEAFFDEIKTFALMLLEKIHADEN